MFTTFFFSFVTLRDNGLSKDLVSCEHQSRSMSSYISQSHRLEVRMNTHQQQQDASSSASPAVSETRTKKNKNGLSAMAGTISVQFVIKYEGKFHTIHTGSCHINVCDNHHYY